MIRFYGRRVRIVLAIVLVCGTTCCAQDEWAWAYRKNFSSKNVTEHTKEMLFTRLDTPPFSQLLCSWNALRPRKGYFSFYAQARNAKTKQWGRWHHIADWGADIQRSFMDKPDAFDQFVYVRLEIDKRTRSDGFRLKAVAHDGVNPMLLKGLVATIADFGSFCAEKPARLTKLPSVLVKNVPQISQIALDHEDRERICSPTSCTMLASFLMHKSFDPLKFAANSYDFGLGAYGSWPFNMAHAFDCTGGRYRFFATRFNSFAQLHHQLARGIPVVVSVRGPMRRAARPYASGHLLLVVGWDGQSGEVICHDPGFEEDRLVQQRYELSEFLAAWERSHRLSYCAENLV